VKLKLACADFSFPLVPRDRVLDLIAMLGFDGVDIGLFAGRSHIEPKEVLQNIPRSARQLADRAQASGLELADIFFQAAPDFQSLAPNHPDSRVRGKARESFQRILEFTARCNARHMTVLPGVHWESESYESSLERCSQELAWRYEQARQVGVVFSVEAHLGSVVPTPKQARQLLKMTAGLSLTLDYGHFTYQGISDRTVEPLVKHASHFHARGGCKGRLQASFTENTIDFKRVLQAMKRANYTGYVGVEYVWIDWERCNEVDNLSETILLRDFIIEAQSS
jgi:sugar phosphate isomerase/epimerase